MNEALRLEREFNAPVARVFEAWTDPKILERWAWGSLGDDVTAVLDLRVGGTYRIETGTPEGPRWVFSGTYLLVLPDERLEYSVQWDAPMGYESPDEKITVDRRDRRLGRDRGSGRPSRQGGRRRGEVSFTGATRPTTLASHAVGMKTDQNLDVG